MSTEEKAKAYDEALKKAKQFRDKDLFAECNGNLVEYIFPELKESEDERIRKALYKAIWTYIPAEEGQEYIAWLEKKGSPILSNSSNIGKNEQRGTAIKE